MPSLAGSRPALATAAGLAALAVLAGRAAPAAAEDPRGMIAHFEQIDDAKVKAASGYRLVGARAYTNVVIGSHQEGEYERHLLILLSCDDKQCQGRPVFLGVGKVTFHGLVDLDGKGGDLEGAEQELARGDWNAELSAKGLRWPALVIEVSDARPASGESRFGTHFDGTERHDRLLVISLRASERDQPRVAELPTADMYPTGAGTTTSYALARGNDKHALEIVGTEQGHIDNDSACLEPAPVKVRWIFRDHRYDRVDLDGSHGCR